MRPFGYEVDRYTIREDEAEHIRLAAADLLAGASIRSIASSWNDSGVRTPGGNEFKPIVVRRILASRRIAGKQDRKGDGVIDAPWPAIIDEVTHKRLQEMLAPKDRTNKSDAHALRTYLLTGGMVVCGLCGRSLVARPDNSGKRGYVCASGLPSAGCGKIRVNAELLENEIGNQLVARLMKSSARRNLLRLADEIRAVARAGPQLIDEANARLEELGEEYAAGNITAATMRTATESLKKQIASSRKAVKTATQLENLSVLDVDDLIEWWEESSTEQRRTLLTILVSRIQVMPTTVRGSKNFDASRVRVDWK